MGEVFLKLLNLSIAAGWIVLALVILRVILRKMPRWIVCWMWAAVGIRLATPFAFESEVTLLPSTKIIDDPESSVRLVIQTAFENFDVSANDLLEGGIYGAAVSPDLFGKIMQVCAVIWVTGMLVMSLYTVISYVRLSRKVRISIRMQDNIYFCDEIDSPFVVGVFRPRIYLPSGMDEKQMFSVIRHEEAHIKRLDPLWKIIGFSLLTVYWFCPLMWLAYMLFSRDIEQACDEKAVSSLNFGGKQEYSRALLYCGARRRVFTAAPVAFGEVG
ncbi:MAG: M56 family metallopeptidase, partial [Clostridia bacterium]|nr:M56 family metallopeptidase [Clostridia bacterium]